MWGYSSEVFDGVAKLRSIVNEVQDILNDNRESFKGLDAPTIISRLETIMKLDPARESNEQQKNGDVV